MQALQVLLVEDSPVNQKLADAVLQKAGHRVTIANHGREALEIWRSKAFDLILMDIQMPEMDGFDATQAIRDQERTSGGHIPIIAMTARALRATASGAWRRAWTSTFPSRSMPRVCWKPSSRC